MNTTTATLEFNVKGEKSDDYARIIRIAVKTDV